MPVGKGLTDLKIFFSPYDFKENDDIIFIYFKNEWKKFYRSNWQNKFS